MIVLVIIQRRGYSVLKNHSGRAETEIRSPKLHLVNLGDWKRYSIFWFRFFFLKTINGIILGKYSRKNENLQ